MDPVLKLCTRAGLMQGTKVRSDGLLVGDGLHPGRGVFFDVVEQDSVEYHCFFLCYLLIK